MFPLIAHGKRCPRCGSRADRVRTPLYLRPLKVLFPSLTRRQCLRPDCRWRGMARPESHATAAS